MAAWGINLKGGRLRYDAGAWFLAPQKLSGAGGKWATCPDNPKPVFGGPPGMGGTPQDLRLGVQLALGSMVTYCVAPGA